MSPHGVSPLEPPTLRHTIQGWDWRLYLSILLYLGLPSAYGLYRVHLVGAETVGAGDLAVVSQWQFVELAVEVFREAATLAIFFFVGSQLRNDATIRIDRLKSVFCFVFAASLGLALTLFLFRDAFIAAIGTSKEVAGQTRAFLAVQGFSIPFAMLAAAMLALFESLRMWRQVFSLAVAEAALRFALDSLFFGGHAFSLDAGVMGWAWSSLLASIGAFAIGFALLAFTAQLPTDAFRKLPSFTDIREYLRVAFGSGIDSLVRNVSYAVMVVRVVNTIGTAQIAGYFIAIQMFWSVLLVPILALADSAKALVANASDDIQSVRKLWQASMVITAAMLLLWLAAMPFLPTAAAWLSDDAETVQWALEALHMLFLPYVLFAFNVVMDSVFYGIGKTRYMAYQAIVTNGSVYLCAFLLYVLGAWQPTFTGVMLLFSLGIIVDTLLTALFLRRVLYSAAVDAPDRTAR